MISVGLSGGNLLAACVLAALIGTVALLAIVVYYGPPRVFAFQLAGNEGRIVSVGGVVNRVSESPSWRALACDTVCFEIIVPQKLAGKVDVSAVRKGVFVAATGFVARNGDEFQLLLAGADSLRVVD